MLQATPSPTTLQRPRPLLTDVPAHPAGQGCTRVLPLFALELSTFASYGTPAIVS